MILYAEPETGLRTLRSSLLRGYFICSKVFNSALWKSLWKRGRFMVQTFEIYGLVALCTHFVQTCFNHLSYDLSLLTAHPSRFTAVFFNEHVTGHGGIAAKLCKSRPKI
jgi:hypothetical protein